MNLYSYDGPVKVMGNIVANHWKAETRAISESKARSNFMYQYKKTHNMANSTKIEVPGTIVLIDEGGY